MKLKRLLTHALVAGLVFGGGYAIAQTFTRALQLSQDTSGAFLIDSNQNMYLANKIMSPTGSTSVRNTPTVSAFASTATVAGTDTAGTITAGTSMTGVTLTFGTAYGATPNCVVTWQTSGSTSTPTAYVPAAATLSISQGSSTGNKINYFCIGTTS